MVMVVIIFEKENIKYPIFFLIIPYEKYKSTQF